MNKLHIKLLIVFFAMLFLVSTVSAVPPDTNNNGCVSITELSNYVSLWLNNSGITLSQVSVGVSWWLNGCVPVVSILSPVNNSQYYSGSNITINVSASDADGSISHVEFYRGTSNSGLFLFNDSNPPFVYSWSNVQPGNYTVSVVAYDNSGMSTRATSFVRVISAPEVCGNGVCSVSETCSSCPQDCGACPVLGSNIIIDHTSIKKFNTIPSCAITNAKQDLHIAFSHTSHGSQIPSGMNAMRTYNSMYSYSSTGGVNTLHFEDYPGRNVEYDGFGTGYCYDLGVCDNGAEGILLPTRTFLNSARGQDINVIMWSWSSILYHDIDFYLEKMQTLIVEYENGSPLHPLPVKFVFITGHLDSQGPGDGNYYVDYQNRQIRAFIYDESPNAFCKQHECILYDYGDMEEYDPDGNYFLDNAVSDNLDYSNHVYNWGTEYLGRYPTGMDADLTSIIANNLECAHSDSPYGAYVNCALKAKAAWYMYARLAGWNGVSQTCN